MDNYSGFGFEDMVKEDRLRLEEKKKIRKAANIIGVAFIVFWILPYLFNTVVFDIAQLLGLEQQLVSLYADPAFILVLQIVISILTFTVPFFIIPLSSGKRISELANFGRPDKELLIPLILIGVGTSAFANIATNAIASLFSYFGIEFLSPNFEYPGTVAGTVLSVLAVAATPALAEEFAMRGTVMGSIRKYGDDLAILMSATVFAIMHGNLVQIPFAFIMGLVIGYAVIKTGSIWTGIIIHFINNFASVLLDLLMEQISSVLLQNAIAVVYFGVCFLCAFIGIFLVNRQGSEIWRLNKPETRLKLGDKVKYFLTSPCIIVSIGLTVIDCLQNIYIP